MSVFHDPASVRTEAQTLKIVRNKSGPLPTPNRHYFNNLWLRVR